MTLSTLENRGSATCCWTHRKISWSGIFAGIVTALVVEALLNLLGLGIGLVSFTPDKGVAEGLGIGSVIWLILVSIISLFFAGWIAAIASGKVLNKSGALQGFITWGLASLIVLFLMSSTVGSILGGVGSALTNGLKTAGSAALGQNSDSALKIPGLASLQARIKPGVSPERAADALKEAVQAYIAADNDQEKNDARQRLSLVISQNTDLSPEEAKQKVAEMEQSYQKLKDKATEIAKKTSHVIGGIAIAAFVSFLLGAVAAIFGGIAGSTRNRHNEDLEERGNTPRHPL